MNIKKFVVALSILAVFITGSAVSVGALTPVHVASFSVTYSSGMVNSLVLVRDSLNRPVPGAAVQMSFEQDGRPTILKTAYTGPLGYARISIALPRGSWVVCIEEIHKLGYEWNPTMNYCKSIAVP